MRGATVDSSKGALGAAPRSRFERRQRPQEPLRVGAAVVTGERRLSSEVYDAVLVGLEEGVR